MVAAILTEHEQALASYNRGYYHRHGHAALTEVTGATELVSVWLPNAREYIQRWGITLISRYHQFGTNIAREQQRYDLAITHADQAVAHAEAAHKIKPDSDLMTLVSYRRGIASFEQELTRVDQPGDYRDALSFIDAAFAYAQSALSIVNDCISLEWGLVHAYTSTSEKDKSLVRKQLIDAYRSASDYWEENDVYSLKYNPSWYHLTYAEALIGLGDYAEALGQLDVAEEMTPIELTNDPSFSFTCF